MDDRNPMFGPRSIHSRDSPEQGWVCFHCGETFTHAVTARAHFGADEGAKPGCLLRMQPGERPLLRHIRFLEGELAKLRHEVCDEDTALHRVMHGMRADHAVALRNEEEKGYARGLADGRKYPCEAA